MRAKRAEMMARMLTKPFPLSSLLAVFAAASVALAFVTPWIVAVIAIPVMFALSAFEYEPFLLLVLFLLPVGWLLKSDFLIHDVMTTVRLVVVVGFFAGRLLRGFDIRGLWRPSLSRWSLMFGVATVLSVAFGTQGLTHNSARSLALVTASLCFYLFIVAWADSTERIERIVRVLLYSTIATSIFAVVQEIVGGYTSIWLYFYPPDDHLAPWDGRATSFLNYSNSLAGYLELILPFALACCALRSAKWRLLGLCALGSGLVALVLTQSRAGITAFGCVTVVAILLLVDNWPRRILLLAGVGIFGSALYIVGTVVSPERVGELGLASSVGRLVLWTVAWNMFSHSPIFGVGIGNFSDNYGYYFQLSWLEPGYLTVNNLYLELLSEIGILGFASFLGLLLLTMRQAYVRFRRELDPFARALFFGVIGAATAVLVHGVLDLTLDVSPQFDTLFWVMLALLTAQLCLARKPPAQLAMARLYMGGPVKEGSQA